MLFYSLDNNKSILIHMGYIVEPVLLDFLFRGVIINLEKAFGP